MNQAGPEATGTGCETTNCCAVLTVVIIAVVLVIPPLYAYSNLGLVAIFNYFAQDAFYYLNVAQNSTGPFYTFDGELPTNGFHPFWQYYETYLFDWIGRGDQVAQMWAVFFSSVIFTTAGYLFIGLGCFRITRSVLLSVLNVPGFFYLVFSFVLNFYGSPWSFMNGMESPFSVLFGGVLIWLIAFQFTDPEKYNNNPAFYLALGLVNGLVIMARLDDVFLWATIALAVLAVQGPEIRERVICIGAFLLPGVIFLSSYLLYNYYSVGTPLPISGLAKAGLSVGPNLRELLSIVSSLPSMDEHTYKEVFFRQAQIFGPPAFAIFFAVVIWHKVSELGKLRSKWAFLLALLAYVLLKALYNFVNVHVNLQGLPWYYTLSILIVNFMACILAADPYRQHLAPYRPVKVWTAGIVGVLLLLHVLGVVKAKYQEGSTLHELWQDREAVARILSERVPHPKLIEFDDGIIAYTLQLPAVHGMGFVVDWKGHLALKNGHFLDYCYKRGFNTLAFLQYLQFRGEDMSSDEIEALFQGYYDLELQDISDFTFRVVYIHPNSGAVFVNLEPKKRPTDAHKGEALTPSPH